MWLIMPVVSYRSGSALEISPQLRAREGADIARFGEQVLDIADNGSM
jgi:hypothetical protein